MTTLQLAIVCLTALAITATICASRGPAARSRAARGSRVTINTLRPDDQTLTGIIDGEWPDRVRLVDAHVVTPSGAQPVPGGVVSIPKANEAWRQEHPDG